LYIISYYNTWRLHIANATCIKTNQNPKSRGSAERRLYFLGFMSIYLRLKNFLKSF
jgi:hypothetical protein